MKSQNTQQLIQDMQKAIDDLKNICTNGSKIIAQHQKSKQTQTEKKE